jgi:hypothetical protein
MKSLLEMLDPSGFSSQFGMVRQPEPTAIPDPPLRPDYADVIHSDNLGIEEINDSVLEAEIMGGLPRMSYPLPLEPR